MRTFRYERLLQWSECDPAGIIFFPHYAKWMVEGVNMLFLSLGIDPTGTNAENRRRGLPSTGFSMKFIAPAVLHDRLVHEIAIVKIGTKSLGFQHRILRGTQCLAEAEETRVWTESDAAGIKSVPIPDDVRSLLDGDAPIVSNLKHQA